MLDNQSLTSLNLSGEIIAYMQDRTWSHVTYVHVFRPLAANESLVSLDLSWNKIRPGGGVAICSALKVDIGSTLWTCFTYHANGGNVYIHMQLFGLLIVRLLTGSPTSTVLLIYAWWLITKGERCAEVRQPFDERSLDAGCYVYCRSSDEERNIDVPQCDV